MLNTLGKIRSLLTKSEKKTYFAITIFLLLITFLEMFSLALILPVFNIVFLNEAPNLKIFSFIDTPLLNDNDIKVTILTLLFFCYVIKNSFSIYYNYFTLNFFYKFHYRIVNYVIANYLNQNYEFYLTNKSKDVLVNTFTHTNNFRDFLVSLQIFITEFLLILGLVSFLLYTSFGLFLYFFLIFTFVFFLYIMYSKGKITSWSILNNENTSLANNLLVEGKKGIKDIIIYSLTDYFLDIFKKTTFLVNRANRNLEFINLAAKFWIEILVVFLVCSSAIGIIYLEKNIEKFLPIFTLFAVAIFRLLPTVNRMLLAAQILRFTKLSVDNIANCFDDTDKYLIKYSENSLYFEKSIELKNISFAYNSSKKFILENINLKIIKNEKICISGKNGSGKSTLLNILAGLISPTNGKFILDDTNLVVSGNASWFRNVSYVQQEVYLVDETILNNITLGSKNLINQKKINEVVSQLSLNTLFNHLPNGLETKVGESGSKLSGGQKQLISLARSLYKDSEVIIFDEPTSALDVSYIDIFKKFLTNSRNKTIIVVTHDAFYKQDYFDKIYNLEDQTIKLTYEKKIKI
jgi:ABC-type multidrug transport system fused ATPase/permease subunit